MICKTCGCENFNVTRVHRNKRMNQGKYKHNDNVDSREVLCRDCGTRYITETKVAAEIKFKNFKVYTKENDGGEYVYNLFEQ